jgi:MYXO-CTERM domain-containing protein
MTCAPLEEGGDPLCIECTTDAECKAACTAAKDTECKERICDKIIGQCVEALKKNSTPDCCGEGCLRCPEEAPFCLPGPIGTACAECRADMDCKPGAFCLSGSCAPCVQDRRCGERCTSCGGDTPFCFGDRIVEDAECVRCEKDEQCQGGKCNTSTHQCTKGCAMSCATSAPHCDGEKCVECYADTQCPCGGTCDLSNNTCSPSCKTNIDCLGNEHCHWNDDGEAKECSAGPMYPVECSTGLDKVVGQATNALETDDSATFCGFDSSSGSCAASGNESGGKPPSAGLLGLISLLLLAARRGRGKS